jgi:hypothetical protein
MKLNGGPRCTELRNTDPVLQSARAIPTGYVIFIIVLFSSLSLPVSYITMSTTDNFKSSYVPTNGEM